MAAVSLVSIDAGDLDRAVAFHTGALGVKVAASLVDPLSN